MHGAHAVYLKINLIATVHTNQPASGHIFLRLKRADLNGYACASRPNTNLFVTDHIK